MSRVLRAWLWTLMLPACGSEPTDVAPSGAASSAAPTSSLARPASASANAVRGADEIEPVYPKNDLPADPLATRYCVAVHQVASDQRAKCCSDTARAPALGECVRTLSAALRSKAITLDEAALTSCEAASKTLYEGCDWVGLGVAAPAPECLQILRGSIREGAVCRSSLECSEGQRCHGLGATQPGRCGAPHAKDSVCGTGGDTLAGLTAQDSWESIHPECAGLCSQRRCIDATAIGASCKTNVECGVGHSCRTGKCSKEALPGEGEGCAEGGCARGLRCVESKCRKAARAGEPCKENLECAGHCEKGKCAPQCKREMPTDLVPRRSASPGPGTTKPAPKP